MENEKKPKKNKKPFVLILLSILGIALLTVGIILIISGVKKHVPSMGEDGWFDAESSKTTKIFIGIFCIIFSLFICAIGFAPSLHKAALKTHKYILEETKDDLIDIAGTKGDIYTNSAKNIISNNKEDLKKVSDDVSEILGDGIANVVDSFKGNTPKETNINETNNNIEQRYCHNCGQKIRKNARFCPHCGTKQ